jgi:hypothetical protein
VSDAVFCRNCLRELDERSDVPAEERRPCPVCGSTIREFRESGTVYVRVTAGGARAGGIAPTASVPVRDAPRVHVESVPVDETAEAETIRGRYRATLDWHRLEDGLWLLHVLNQNGRLVEGGIGDDPEGALLEVYERLIPPIQTD